ncbi:hypothetical protein ACFFQW_12165 [Umezawaea endophytica]|uniref:DUF3558 domain-containing protein n=1 Tax=Umezawaea endophytica TaxID=1654476 RepID=A0A9X2VXD0_9PSEU|nr:hypothetical protein [Umezawaea endophytica]MCS7484548.1 hypothetical protein [Umezawaea endophytica]
MRRAHVAVVVATTLVLTSCSLEQRPLRRGFAQDDPAIPTTTSTSASPTAKAAPATSSSAAPSAAARPVAEFAALALPQAALTEDGLDVRESAAAAPSAAESVCGKQVSAPGRAADGYRIATRSQSGASKLEQRIAAYPKGKAETVATEVREALSCGEVELGRLSGVDDAVGWCEELAGGRGACTAVLAKDDLVITLRMETISVARAQDVVTRLAGAAAGLLAKA